MAQQSEYMTITEAREELGVNKVRMADLIRRGYLPTETNPFDRRSKLVRRSDVEALKAKMPAKCAA
jgi:DNA-binding MarR family transcriptional regulator